MAIPNRLLSGIPVKGSPDITLPDAGATVAEGRAVLFADVSKSMLLYERLGDAAARRVIDMLLELASTAVKAHRGRVVKTIGDEVFAVLPTADAAARTACDLLVAVDSCERQGDVALGMHVGFHAGQFI